MSRTKGSDSHGQQPQDKMQLLHKALRHWQTLDAEYEALKEEVEAVSDNSSQTDKLCRIRRGFEGELLRGRELDEVFGLEQQRTRNQIINVLQRRVEYVSRNIQDLQRQIHAAEDDDTSDADVEQADVVDDEHQNITDIVEMLDDDDNVVSYQLKRPGDSVARIAEALEKTGIAAAPDASVESKKPAAESAPQQQRMKLATFAPRVVPTFAPRETPNSSEQPRAKPPVSPPTKPATCARDAEAEDASTSPEMSRPAKRVKRIMDTAKEQERISREQPVIPEDEDPEDAALRQQMLRYGMNEVGAVVAELQLEEGSTDDGGSDAYDDDDYSCDNDECGDDDDADDAEDRFGRSTGRVVTDDYRQRMLELEQKLGIKSRFTQAAEEDAGSEEGESDDDEGIGRIVVKRESETSAPSKSSLKTSQGGGDSKKGVRFAHSLDIAPERQDAEAPAAASTANINDERVVEPLSDIVERPASFSHTPAPKAPETKSRFKRAMHDAPTRGILKSPLEAPPRLRDQLDEDAPMAPEGATLADRLVEREMAESVSPSDMDDAVRHAEIAAEHQRLRNKFIQRQGGYLERDEAPVEVLDPETGEPPIMSRFKAARLSRH